MPTLLAIGVLPGLLACDREDSETKSLPGELGDNHFFYECATIDDAQCRDELREFPDKIAVGALFDLSARSGNRNALQVQAVSPLMVAAVSGAFQFREPGISAFLALDSSDKLVDFVHVEAANIAAIGVQDSFGRWVDELTLTSGQKTTITAVPLDEREDVLAGSLTFRWVTDNEAVVTVDSRGTVVKIQALEPGTAQVRVSLGEELSLLLDVTVRERGGTDTGGGSDDAAVDAGDGGVGDDASTALAPDSGASNSDGGSDASAATTSADSSAEAVEDAAVTSDAGGQP